MRNLTLGIIILAATISVSAQGTSSRLGDYTEQLRRATSRLADRSAQDLLQNRSNAPDDIREALLAQQMHASAMLLVDMVRSRRPAREMREMAAALTEMSDRSPSYGRSSSLWRNVREAVSDLNREVGYQPGSIVEEPLPPAERPIIGRVEWRGWVDDRVHLVIRGRNIETRTVSGSPRAAGTATFTSPLPDAGVEVGVTKNRGRGTVAVLQQPSRVNDYTAVVEIYDGNGGAQEYRLDIFWR